MLKLSTSYSKKVPAEQEFSSQSYHASVELELSDALEPQQVEQKIHETFDLVRNAVEAELKGTARVVPQTAPKSQTQNGSQQAAKASNKQVKFILDLAGHQGFELSALNAHIRKLYGVQSVYDLDRKQASALLDSLRIRKAA